MGCEDGKTLRLISDELLALKDPIQVRLLRHISGINCVHRSFRSACHRPNVTKPVRPLFSRQDRHQLHCYRHDDFTWLRCLFHRRAINAAGIPLVGLPLPAVSLSPFRFFCLLASVAAFLISSRTKRFLSIGFVNSGLIVPSSVIAIAQPLATSCW